jgi:hypothetical protein
MVVRQELLSGAIGQVFLSVFAALNIFTILLFFEAEFILLGIVAYLLFSVFVLLFLVSATKMRSQLGSSVGVLGSLFGLAACIVALLVNLMFGKVGYHYVYAPLGMTFLLWVPILVFTGLTMVLIGTSLITYRQRYFPSRLWIATGVLYIVAGSFEFTIFLSIIGDILMIVSGILGAVCLFTSISSKDIMALHRRQLTTGQAGEKVAISPKREGTIVGEKAKPTAAFVLSLIVGFICLAIGFEVIAVIGSAGSHHGSPGEGLMAIIGLVLFVSGILIIVFDLLIYSRKGNGSASQS